MAEVSIKTFQGWSSPQESKQKRSHIFSPKDAAERQSALAIPAPF